MPEEILARFVLLPDLKMTYISRENRGYLSCRLKRQTRLKSALAALSRREAYTTDGS